MNKFILTAVAVASLIANSAQARIGWDLKKCQDTYGTEVKPSKTVSYGEVHYFKVGEISLRVVLRDNEVKSILYSQPEAFTMDEIKGLEWKNQESILGGSNASWSEPLTFTVENQQAFGQLLIRDGEPILQCLVAKLNQPFVEIRTLDQAAVENADGRNAPLEKIKGL